MRFTKMHGAGNDYVYIDCFGQPAPTDPPALAKIVSDRHTGIGADGLILIGPSDSADAAMRMYNADGSPAEMCGNGIRCVGKYLYDYGICKNKQIQVETSAGILALEVVIENGKVGHVRVDMGEPELRAPRIPTTLLPGQTDASCVDAVVNAPLEIEGQDYLVTCVSMGNPHCVLYFDNLDDELVNRLGPKIETDPRFPERVNVEFVQLLSDHEVRQRTWERGSGETMACGTGASAVCVAGVLTGRTARRLAIHLLGGTLELEWNQKTNHVLMTGPAVEVFTGTWNGG